MPDAKCTPESGEGALPAVDEVIPDTSMYKKYSSIEIFDLYGVGESPKEKCSVPFVHNVELGGPQGEVVRMRSVIDDGAMVAAIDSKVYTQIKHRLSELGKSARILRMADGRLVPSIGTWTGPVTLGGKTHCGCFEVFDSGGAWALLFGKPLLEIFDAMHGYKPDVLHLRDGKDWISLPNQFFDVAGAASSSLIGLTTDIKQRTNFRGGQCASPSRRVQFFLPTIPEEHNDQPPEQLPAEVKCVHLGRNARRRDAKLWAEVIINQKARRDARGDDEPPTRQVQHKSILPTPEQNDETTVKGMQEPEVQREHAGENIENMGVDTQGREIPPSRRVSAPELFSTPEPHDQHQFIPVHTHPLTAAGVPRRTAEERAAWRASKGLPEKVSKGERKMKWWLRRDQERESRRERRNVITRTDAVGDESSPTREVPPHMPLDTLLPNIDPRFISSRMAAAIPNIEAEGEPWSDIWTLDEAAGPGGDHPGAEQPAMSTIVDPDILTILDPEVIMTFDGSIFVLSVGPLPLGICS
ncbi:hypothetical protein C8J57DRAFT_1540122 [Mycena rebaudengoi]|nr:hypothetical protein C8J57DRAFT_1540122 [Mycena rebaudengoi]